MGYVRYGSTSDLDYFTERVEIEKNFFEIVELAWPLASQYHAVVAL